MLFNILPAFADDFQVFNLFRYLTCRAAGAVLTALVLRQSPAQTSLGTNTRVARHKAEYSMASMSC